VLGWIELTSFPSPALFLRLMLRAHWQALICELNAALGLTVAASCRVEEMGACQRMLVYLNGLTWTSGSESELFAADVKRAMDAEKPLLLVHEMPGAVDVVAERHSVQFDSFFACDQGATPDELQQRNIYSSIAIPLKGGAWRRVGLVMMVEELGGRSVVGALHTATCMCICSGASLWNWPRRIQRQQPLSSVATQEVDLAVVGSSNGPYQTPLHSLNYEELRDPAVL
jgi:hypothetical protein